MVAANTAVNAPVNATTDIATSEAEIRANNLTIRNTPAATIVAACIKALTGVGPSIASGNHVCSGNCADFPTAPANIPSDSHVAAKAVNPEADPSMSGISNGFRP